MTPSTVEILCVVAWSPYPADGVCDHARGLARELSASGTTADVAVVDWRGRGLTPAMRDLLAEIRLRKPRAIVLHYSHLAWSRRGLPFGLVSLIAVLRLRGPVVLWVHDPDRIEGLRLRHRLGTVVKGMGLRLAAMLSGRVVVAVEPRQVYWLRRSAHGKVVFCPSAPVVRPTPWQPARDVFTVTCFGVSVARTPEETDSLRKVCGELAQRRRVRLKLVGASDQDSPPDVVKDLAELGIDCEMPGYLPPQELATFLASSGAFLVVRKGLTTRSSSLAAALACGVPVVGMEGPETGEILRNAGLAMSPSSDWQAMAAALDRIAASPEYANELSKNSAALAAEWFSWSATIDRVGRLFGIAPE